jgi:hypothetical protein
MTITCPVVKSLAGPAGSSAIPVMSPTVPMRWAGVFDTTKCDNRLS